jgi:hypothetical protein
VGQSELLVAGVGVYRGHDVLLRPELLVQDHDDGGEAFVVQDVPKDMVLQGIVLVVADAYDQVMSSTLAERR